MQRKKRGHSAEYLAEVNRIIAHIPRPPDDTWISLERLAAAVDMTEQQVMNRIAALRDLIPDSPLVSSPEGYQFTLAEERVGRFHNAAVRTAHTRIRRSWNGVMKPFIQRTADPAVSKMLSRQFERILEDLGDLIEA